MTVEEICKEAGFTRERYPEIYDEISEEIKGKLYEFMNFLSATRGLTWERVEVYEKQCRVFVDDLKRFVATGSFE